MRCAMMRPRLCALGLGALAATLSPRLMAGEGEMQVYECHQGGTVTFSGAPCADPLLDLGPARQQTLELDYPRPDATQLRAAEQSAAALEQQAGRVAEADLLDTEILNLESRISNLETERDARVAALRDQLAQGTESTDTASWAAGLNQQIVSVTNNYNDTILAERARLNQLQGQRAFLGSVTPPSAAGQ
jgi:hypothetical protein